MRSHVLIPKCMKEIEWHNIGMLMNMQANALKYKVIQISDRCKIHAYQYLIFPRIHYILDGSIPFLIEEHFPLVQVRTS